MAMQANGNQGSGCGSDKIPQRRAGENSAGASGAIGKLLQGRDVRLAALGLRPLPVLDFRFVQAFRVGVVDALDDLAFEPFLQVRTRTLETRHAVNHVGGEREAIDLIANSQFQWRIDVALLFVAADVDIRMVGSAIGELVDEPRVAVKIKYHRLVGSEKGVKIAIGKAVGMIRCGCRR